MACAELSRFTSTVQQLEDGGAHWERHGRARPEGRACPPSNRPKPYRGARQTQQQPQAGSSCCTSRPANDTRGRFMPTHCATAATATASTEANRLKGGGNGEQTSTIGLVGGDADFTWYNNRFGPRLEGGACGGTHQPPPPPPTVYPASSCGKSATVKQKGSFQSNFDDYLQFGNVSPEYLAGNKCKLKHSDEKTGLKGECSCPARDRLEHALKKKGNAVCTKNHCMGTDCLIKAFKDAQEFVDSIGKVPGLAGLGITESPYFGTNREPKEEKKSESKGAAASKQFETTSGLCNAQNIENIKKSNYSATATTFPATSAKKPALVQEAITSVPDPSTHPSLKSKKKEEKSEKTKEVEISSTPQIVEETPCGEPKCRSRPKKTCVEVKESQEKVDDSKKSSPVPKTDKKVSKTANSGGEKKSSKKQYDYNYGNMYPQNVYGHKACNLLRSRVPPYMGWLWNSRDPVTKSKPRSGWKPGAISVTLKELLKIAREGFFKETKRPMSMPKLGGKKAAPMKTMSFTGMKKGGFEEPVEEEPEFPPTLHVHRKDGVYYVTMYPIRQDTSGVPRVDEPTNPLQFKIVKSKDSLASSSEASDMEIEFSPPAAVNRPRKMPNVIHVDTQVNQQEILDSFKKKDDKKKKDGKDGKKKKKELVCNKP